VLTVRVLVIDDDEGLAEGLRRGLEERRASRLTSPTTDVAVCCSRRNRTMTPSCSTSCCPAWTA